MNDLSIEAINKAIDENQNENYAQASDLLILVYNIDKENNTDYLYYAASSAVNGGDYDRALAYYQELRDLDYTGSIEKFYATENETGEEVELSAENYALFKKLKTYSNFRSEMMESKLPEIIKNIALIYVQQKRNDLAIGAIKDARAVNPLDVGLILTEANLYIQLGDKQKFADLMKEAIEKDPNNHILYFNLGVITAEQGDRDKARSYYESAIELDPSYAASYLNLAALILEGEPELVEKMNSLGNSRADNIKYEQFKKQREGLFLEAVPVLENLTEIDPSNVEALTTLKNIFGTIGDAANFKKMKEKLEALGQ
jgi:tetratricopeptide (TPR) repeat protein